MERKEDNKNSKAKNPPEVYTVATEVTVAPESHQLQASSGLKSWGGTFSPGTAERLPPVIWPAVCLGPSVRGCICIATLTTGLASVSPVRCYLL